MNINKAIKEAYDLFQEGKLQEAAKICLKIVAIAPQNIASLHLLGLISYELMEYDFAIQLFSKLAQLDPNNPVHYYHLGISFRQTRQFEAAIKSFQRAVQLNPNYSESLYELGNAFLETGQFNDAITCYQKALHFNSNNSDVYFYLGIALRERGKQDEAFSSMDKAILLAPYNYSARFAKCISQLQRIYPDQDSIQTSRNRYYDELRKLREAVLFEMQQGVKSMAEAVGDFQPFYLAYQGYNDRELQRIYGEVVCKIMAYKYPQFAERPVVPVSSFGEPLRVGVVSGYFYTHSNWKIPIKGWIENLDRQRIRLYGYYTGKKKDQSTEDAKLYFSRFVEDIYSFEDLCRIIRNDNLHILIYPEVGMDPLTVRLAALRLAPIQCASWGHPDTSGLPTIDYYLSSDLMEPLDASDHYTEKLIRLPNLSICYTPLDCSQSNISRKTFGLHQTSILYLCCQSLSKYLPQYDAIYPRIAKQVGDCQFLFISDKNSYVTDQFRLRITQSFDKYDLNYDDYVFFLPRLDPSQYNAINYLSDIYLDSIGWSGCNSTLEAISHNLPIVTLPSELMRGRHSFAILTMMGMQDTIAHSLDEYVEIAVRLGLDSGWRNQISNKIKIKKNSIYQDKTCITALEDFLEAVVKEKLT
jgi:protein O-GlcNAc transferase